MKFDTELSNKMALILIRITLFYLFFFEIGSCCVVTSTGLKLLAQMILLPQPPKDQGLQTVVSMLDNYFRE